MTRIPHKPSAVLTQTLRSSGLLSPTKRLRPVSFLRKRARLFLPFSHNDCVSYIVLPGPHRNHLHPFSPFLQSQWTKRPLFYQKPTPHVCPLCLQGITLSSPRPSSSARKHSFRTQFYLNIAHLDKPPLVSLSTPSALGECLFAPLSNTVGPPRKLSPYTISPHPL